MKKPQLQEECKRQNLEGENKSVAEMQVLLIGSGQPARVATAEHPRQQGETQHQQRELEKLSLWAEEE